MKIKDVTALDCEHFKSRNPDNLYLYYNTPTKDTLDIIEQYTSNIPELRDSELTLCCIKIKINQFMSPRKGQGFELAIDSWLVGGWFIDPRNSTTHQLATWLAGKLLIFKELKAMSEDIGRVARSEVSTLFEIFRNYFYASGREVNEKNKKEFIEIVNKIYKRIN